jgi:CubicO group peptidase (beta-lactamase class C family)
VIARIALALAALAAAAPALPAQQPEARCEAGSGVWPGAEWARSNPFAQNTDGNALNRALDTAGRDLPGIYALLVVRHGYLVAERYYHGYGSREAFELANGTRAVLTTIVGAAVASGALASVDLPLAAVLPPSAFADTSDPARAITLRQLLASESPVAPQLLSIALARATRRSTRQVAIERLFTPLGIRDGRWTWPADDAGQVSPGFGLRLSGRDLARIGYLYLRDGCWNGRAVLPAGWAKDAAEQGYAWHAGEFGGRTGYWMTGLGGQYVVAVPELDLVVAIAADPATPPDRAARHLELVREMIVPAAR